MRLVPSTLVLLAAPWLGGCATLDHGTLDEVSVVTEPPGASVVASSGDICTSPCRVSGPRRDNIGVTISKPGYVSQSLTSEAKPDDAAIARESALEPTADALGRVIDVQDGSHYTHVPKALVVTLAPVE